jgi:adenine phosphoribosyltransferase
MSIMDLKQITTTNNDIRHLINIVDDPSGTGNASIDFTSLYADPCAIQIISDWFDLLVSKHNISCIVAIETRGLIWGSIVASRNKLPLLLSRKVINIPGDNVSTRFISRSRLHIATIAKNFKPTGNVMLVDDTIVSGATLEGTSSLISTHWKIPLSNQVLASVLYCDNLSGVDRLLALGYKVEYMNRITTPGYVFDRIRENIETLSKES